MITKNPFSVLALSLIACIALLASAQKLKCSDSGAPGDYSKLGTSLCWQRWNEVRHLNIWSPNHMVLLKVDGNEGRLYRDDQAFGEVFRFLADEEWLWSPDSKAAILTTSVISPAPVIAGVNVFGSKEAMPDVTKIIQRDFLKHHPNVVCARQVNVAGLTWFGGSKQAVLVAEVPPSPRCEKADGYFEAYVIAVPQGTIVHRYSMAESIERFYDALGPALLEDIQAQKEERRSK